MKHTWLLVSLVVVVAVLTLTLQGCAPAVAAGLGVVGGAGTLAAVEYIEASEITQEILTVAGKEAAVWGLKQVPADIAPIMANDLTLACDDAIKYLQSGVLPTADIINQIVSAKFKNLNPVIVSEIQFAAMLLGKLVPTANVFLTSPQISDLIAFLSGIRQGAQQFIVNPQMEIRRKYTLNGRKQLERGDMVPVFPPWFGAKTN